MNRIPFDEHAFDAKQQSRSRFTLPLVSVIIVNFNYGRFLREALDSVSRQSYGNVECIIVDDASSDESGEILDDLEATGAGVTIIRRKKNGGQSLASKDGYEASSGEYIVFLDADDYLLPTFVETHVYVHLSLRIPVGLSSSDMAEVNARQVIVSTSPNFSEFIRSKRGKRHDLLRHFDQNMPELWPFEGTGAEVEDRVHFVAPNVTDKWVWSPTSGTCFRRGALALFFNNPELGRLRSCTDAYLIRGIGVVTGGVLIDRTLSIYRLHGSNSFVRNSHLNGLLHYERGGANDNDQLGRKLAMDHLIDNADFFARTMHSRVQFLAALKALDDSWPCMPTDVKGCRSYLAGKLVSEFPRLRKAIELRNLILWMIWSRIPPWRIIQTVLASRQGRPSYQFK